MRTAKKRSTENCANTAGIKQGDLVEKTPFPTFNGSQEGWAEFKRVFQEMISPSGCAKALELAQLAVKLPAEARLWSKGVSEPTEVWKRLDDLYGDKELAVLSTIYRLESLELLQGPAKKRLEAVKAGFNLYANCLQQQP